MGEPRSLKVIGRADVIDIRKKRTAGRTAMHIHLLFNGLAQILDEMEPVSNLRSLRCPLACCLRKMAATIPADNFSLRLLAQPFCTAFNAAIREEIDHCAPFEIDNDGSVSLRFAPAPIVDADDSWLLGSTFRTLLEERLIYRFGCADFRAIGL